MSDSNRPMGECKHGFRYGDKCEVCVLTARVEQLEREQLIIARTYDPNCDEYHFADEQAKMVAARQAIESVQELAEYLGRDPEGCLSDVADEAMGWIDRLKSDLAAARAEVERLEGVIHLARIQYRGCGGRLTPTETVEAMMEVLNEATDAEGEA